MKVEKYLQGENPLSDSTSEASDIPRYAIFFMMVMVAGVAAQYGLNKIQGVLNVGSDQTRVNVV